MDFRKTYDRIPEQFDKWRPRYCDELYDAVIAYAGLDPGKAALEIGPGTGQATEPFLKTGCNYLAIELGEHLAAFMRNKFGTYDNFHIVNADFETHDFGAQNLIWYIRPQPYNGSPKKSDSPKSMICSGAAERWRCL